MSVVRTIAAALAAGLALAPTAVGACGDAAVAYVVTRGGGEDGTPVRSTIVVADADGRAQRAVAEGAAPLAWSPDGESLLFVRFEDGRYDLYVVRLATSRPRLVAPDAVAATWGPDGNTIAFAATVDRTSAVVLTSLSHGRRRVLIQDATGPAWSPDGRWLAYLRSSGLYLKPIPDGRSVAVGPANSIAAWAPDSQRLAYICGDGLCVYTLRGGVTKIVAIPNPSSPAWSADGTRILVAADGAIWSVSARGGDVRRVTGDDIAAGAPAVRPAQTKDCAEPLPRRRGSPTTSARIAPN